MFKTNHQFTYIYGLHASDSEKIMYIGQAVDTDKRLREHVYDALNYSSVSPRSLWIRNLFSDEKTPKIKKLLKVSKELAAHYEHKMIAYYNTPDSNLLNVTYPGAIYAGPRLGTSKKAMHERAKLMLSRSTR